MRDEGGGREGEGRGGRERWEVGGPGEEVRVRRAKSEIGGSRKRSKD